VPTHRGSSLAPPPITVPLYLVQDIEDNNIGDIGCRYLSSAPWLQLQQLDLCKYAPMQPTTTLDRRAAPTCPEDAWETCRCWCWVIMLRFRWQQHRRRWLPTPRQGRLPPSPRTLTWYGPANAAKNGIGAEGCRHLSKAHWPALNRLSICSTAST
jgi:hypothetical protein